MLGKIKITDCNQCGSPVEATLAELEKRDTFKCKRGHQVTVQMDAQSKRNVKSTKKSLDDLDKALKNFGKGR